MGHFIAVLVTLVCISASTVSRTFFGPGSYDPYIDDELDPWHQGDYIDQADGSDSSKVFTPDFHGSDESFWETEADSGNLKPEYTKYEYVPGQGKSFIHGTYTGHVDHEYHHKPVNYDDDYENDSQNDHHDDNIQNDHNNHHDQNDHHDHEYYSGHGRYHDNKYHNHKIPGQNAGHSAAYYNIQEAINKGRVNNKVKINNMVHVKPEEPGSNFLINRIQISHNNQKVSPQSSQNGQNGSPRSSQNKKNGSPQRSEVNQSSQNNKNGSPQSSEVNQNSQNSQNGLPRISQNNKNGLPQSSEVHQSSQNNENGFTQSSEVNQSSQSSQRGSTRRSQNNKNGSTQSSEVIQSSQNSQNDSPRTSWNNTNGSPQSIEVIQSSQSSQNYLPRSSRNNKNGSPQSSEENQSSQNHQNGPTTDADSVIFPRFLQDFYSPTKPPSPTPTTPSTTKPPLVPTARPTAATLWSMLVCVRACPVTSEYNPVCGSSNFTYNNEGLLNCARECGINVTLARRGPCSRPAEIVKEVTSIRSATARIKPATQNQSPTTSSTNQLTRYTDRIRPKPRSQNQTPTTSKTTQPTRYTDIVKNLNNRYSPLIDLIRGVNANQPDKTNTTLIVHAERFK